MHLHSKSTGHCSSNMNSSSPLLPGILTRFALFDETPPRKFSKRFSIYSLLCLSFNIRRTNFHARARARTIETIFRTERVEKYNRSRCDIIRDTRLDIAVAWRRPTRQRNKRFTIIIDPHDRTRTCARYTRTKTKQTNRITFSRLTRCKTCTNTRVIEFHGSIRKRLGAASARVRTIVRACNNIEHA